MLSGTELQKGLKTRIFGKQVFAFETIDSTNLCAKTLAALGKKEGAVVIAEEQTAGRGRLGRSWYSKPGENLTFSLILRPSVTASAVNLLPLFVGVAVAEAVEATTGLRVECKWPNDLLLNRKKFCGILIEGSLKDSGVDFVVVGVGINVNQQVFPADLMRPATSLYLESGTAINRVRLFQQIMISLERHYAHLASKGFESVLTGWSTRSTMVGTRISVSLDQTVLSGTVKGLNANGALILTTDEGDKLLYAGDVSLTGI